MAFQVVSHAARPQMALSQASAPETTEVRDGGGCDTEKTREEAWIPDASSSGA